MLGLGFGDEGKGATVDRLVRGTGVDLVVRFNGGPQAAHHVVGPGGQRHAFAQFGAGTLVPGARTLLGGEMLVDPLALLREEEALRRLGVNDALDRHTLDARCPLVTPYHRALNRLRELARGEGRHGTCGLGVGEARLDAESGLLPVPRAGDLSTPQRLRSLLRHLRLAKLDHAEQLLDRHPGRPELEEPLTFLQASDSVDDLLAAWTAAGERLRVVGPEEVNQLLRNAQGLIFEGAQGALLDRDQGFWPHVTPSRTGPAAALEMLAEAEIDTPVRRIGVLRAYHTRHGEGPLPTEDASWTAAFKEHDNEEAGWQGSFRVGPLDLALVRYGVQVVGGVDALALGHLDVLAGRESVPVGVGYRSAEEGEALPADLFEGDESPHGLRFSDRPDRDRQGRLTVALERCRPVFEELPGWSGRGAEAVKGYVRRVEEAVGASAVLESWGARAEDGEGMP